MLTILLLAGGTGLAAAQQAAPTTQEILDQLIGASERQCAKSETAPETPAEDWLRRDAQRQARAALCECMPAAFRQLRSSLPPAELAATPSQQEFRSRYVMKVTGHCGALQLQATFGAGCPERMARLSGAPPPPKYCDCMRESLARLSDEELAAMGVATADYAPLAAEAQKKGQGKPPLPPPLKRYMEVDKACKTP